MDDKANAKTHFRQRFKPIAFFLSMVMLFGVVSVAPTVVAAVTLNGFAAEFEHDGYTVYYTASAGFGVKLYSAIFAAVHTV